MAKSQILPAVVQALFLSACALIIYEHLMEKAFVDISNSDAWTNITKVMEMVENGTVNANNLTSMRNTSMASSTDMTSLNQTAAGNSGPSGDESFSRKVLPRTMLFNAVLFSVQYYWHLWLERSFPGRPRHTEAPQGEKDFGSEMREEAVVQKWLVQGKVRRASLSWGNTFIKWLFDMTLGQIWLDGIGYPLLEGLFKRRSFEYICDDVKWGLLYRPWVTLFSFRPLASLLSFVVVPAHRRIVFMQGSELLWNLFLGLFVGVVLPWLSKTRFVHEVIATVASEAEKNIGKQTVLPAAIDGPDEL